MILRLRLPNKLLLCLLSLTAGAVAGVFWTVHGSAGTASNGSAGRAFGVIGATNGNHNGAKSIIGRGSARGKSGRGGDSVSTMLTLAAGSYTSDFSLEDRNLGFGANGVDVFVNDVQTGS